MNIYCTPIFVSDCPEPCMTLGEEFFPLPDVLDIPSGFITDTLTRHTLSDCQQGCIDYSNDQGPCKAIAYDEVVNCLIYLVSHLDVGVSLELFPNFDTYIRKCV